MTLAGLLLAASSSLLVGAAGDTTQPDFSKFPINEDGKVVTPSTAYFLEHREKFRQEAPSIEPGAVVLLGDSLTARFPMEKLPAGVRIVNRGIGGDKVGGWKFYGLLDRLDCSVEALKPSKLFLMIGVNDIVSANTPEDEMTSGMRTLLTRLKETVPADRIYVQSVLPVRDKFAEKNAKIDAFNVVLQREAETAGVHFLNLHPLFEDTEGKLSDQVTSDGIHLRDPGYDIWAEQLAKYL